MVEAAEQAGIVTQVGFMFRFGAAVARLKQLIDSGEAGPVGLMTARYFCNSLHADWWRERDKSGGQLVEQVIHMVDLMRYLMGDASTVYSLQQNLFHQETPNYTVEDISGTVFGFRNGGIGTISATNGAIPGLWTNDYRVVTQNVTAEFDDANHATLVFRPAAGGVIQPQRSWHPTRMSTNWSSSICLRQSAVVARRKPQCVRAQSRSILRWPQLVLPRRACQFRCPERVGWRDIDTQFKIRVRPDIQNRRQNKGDHRHDPMPVIRHATISMIPKEQSCSVSYRFPPRHPATARPSTGLSCPRRPATEANRPSAYSRPRIPTTPGRRSPAP